MKCPSCGNELQFMSSINDEMDLDYFAEEEEVELRETYYCVECEDYWDKYK